MTATPPASLLHPFAPLSAAGEARLARGLVRKAFAADTTLLRKGTPVSGAYIVLAGRLRVFTLAPGGTEATLYFLDPGETCVLALNCLFNDLRYPAWVETESNAVVGVIPGKLYRELFAAEPGVQDLTVRALATAVFRLMSELELVHARPQRERLAHFILLHAARDGQLAMTQQAIAHHLGTTREVIARLLRGFVARGWVRTRRGGLAVTDRRALAALLSAD